MKHLTCEFTDCSLCFNQWATLTYLIFVIIAMTLFFVFTIFKLTSNCWTIPSTFYNIKFFWFLLFSICFHTLSLASSSFVEEEHQTWYFITHTFLLIICIQSLKKRQNDQWFLNAELLKSETRKKRNVRNIFEQFFFEFNWFMLLVLLLVGRRLNQTGDKWMNLPDIGDFLMMEQNRLWNSFFVVICESSC